ncbi:MAG: glutamate-5-semialdehyde dehydrogenase [Chloroflexota bacterium]
MESARAAAPALAALDDATKSAVLLDLAERLLEATDIVLSANETDMETAEAGGMAPAMLDRLLLTRERLVAMAADVRHVAGLPDPIGEEFDGRVLPNGLRLCRRRVPLGVIGVVYEARPNVTIDVAVLCLKSGNPVILRGGKEAAHSNRALAAIVRTSLQEQGAPADAVQLIRDPDRALVGEMIRMQGQIDLVVPRGGAGLIEYIRNNALVPVVTGGIGVCHTYVHDDADIKQALEIVDNAKRRRPTICNALDTVIVHTAIASTFLPALAERWAAAGVEMRCDPTAMDILDSAEAPGPRIGASDDDWGHEFLSLRAAVRVVNDLDEAIAHIQRYGSGHSEAIITDGYTASRDFVNRVDAAAVYVNASTQFTDGSQFGLGAELGISTQKFHARGPLGLRELTSYKWVVLGDGQTRP